MLFFNRVFYFIVKHKLLFNFSRYNVYSSFSSLISFLFFFKTLLKQQNCVVLVVGANSFFKLGIYSFFFNNKQLVFIDAWVNGFIDNYPSYFNDKKLGLVIFFDQSFSGKRSCCLENVPYVSFCDNGSSPGYFFGNYCIYFNNFNVFIQFFFFYLVIKVSLSDA